MSESKTRIIVVDDDARLRDLLNRYLTAQGLSVRAIADGNEMNRWLARERYDLMVLDLMLPGEDGLSICRRLRGLGDKIPIIMLTAKGDDVDRIVGLEVGADDYLAKPFNPRELLARIRAVLRRAGERPPAGTPRFRSGGLEIDFDARAVTVDGRGVFLTGYEFQLLAVLARAAGRVLSREQLLDALTGASYEAFDRSIDVHISKLRSKLERNAKAPRYIKTIRGVGYVLPRQGKR